MDLEGFKLAADRQLDLWVRKGLSGTISLGGADYPVTKARDSLEFFLQMIDDFKACRQSRPSSDCFAYFNQSVRASFHVFAPDLQPGDPRYGTGVNAFFTGYATQPIAGRSRRDSQYSHAVYAAPQDASHSATRGQIDFHGALDGKGLELVYAADLFDLYLLHIEGGGYVTVDDGRGGQVKNFYLSYDGTNGQHFEWISNYMYKQGYISNRSSGAQRKFLRQHPEKAEEILSVCASYVFFRVSSTPPDGMQGIPVSPGRSVATDRKLYPFKGLLTFVQAQRAVDTGVYDLEQEDTNAILFQPFSRFFLDQDTGGAIVGKGRADIYFGVDEYAQYAATYQAEEGNIFFLLLK